MAAADEGVAGAAAAVDYLASVGRRYGDDAAGRFPGFAGRRRELKLSIEAVRAYERALCERLVAGLQEIPGLRIYGITDPARFDERVPTVSFTLEGLTPNHVARRLDEVAWSAFSGGLGVTALKALAPASNLVTVTSSASNWVWETSPGERVMDERVAYLISDILSDDFAHHRPRLSQQQKRLMRVPTQADVALDRRQRILPSQHILAGQRHLSQRFAQDRQKLAGIRRIEIGGKGLQQFVRPGGDLFCRFHVLGATSNLA